MEGARTLVQAQPEKGRILFRPTLALAGHGLEMLLKACFYLNQKSPPTRGPEGHNIIKLWSDDVSEPVRGAVYLNARLAAETARIENVYPDVPSNDDADSKIEEYVNALGKLHGDRGHVLRYPSAEGQLAPRSPFLVETLWRTADDMVKRPSDFELSRFLGLG